LYTGRFAGGPWLTVERRAGAEVCLSLPHIAVRGGAGADGSTRYVRVRIADGVAAGPLVAHLYDLGPTIGYRLAGIERPER
ncbi:MAG TPA: hypothetical protein VN894_04935, partial [Polyangiaceae bacterium]|nr:hypothetical protein [Polyangiaceae bacterium]